MTTTSPSIFISYRRDDSAGHAGRLADRLAQRVGADRVFRDIEDIAAGEDFVACLERKLDECQVVLALIGPRWLATGSSGRPRICEEKDWVRREIARAMERELRVIPLLLQGANMPGADVLPPDLQRLTRLNALELREAQFDRDLDYLVSVLVPPDRSARARRFAIAASLSALLAGGAYGAYWTWDRSPERAEQRLTEQGLALDADTFVEQSVQGNIEAVRLFIRAGQDVNAPNQLDVTALQAAASKDDLELVHLLLDADAAPDSALPIAAGLVDGDIFDLLMAQGPGGDAIDQALVHAAGAGDIARMERLLTAGAKIDVDSNRALRSAASSAQPAALRWLIARGASAKGTFSDSGDTVLHIASSASMPEDAVGDPVAECVEVLLDAGADPNALRGPGGGLTSTPLMIAAHLERPEIARLLLDHQAQPDLASTDGTGATALMLAIGEDNAEIATLLLERGARIDAVDASGATALIRAAGIQHLAMVNLLIEHGADVNRQDKGGLSALMRAARNLDPHTVERLLDADADLAARSENGNTALAWLESVHVYPGTREKEDADRVEKLLVAHAGDMGSPASATRQVAQSRAREAEIAVEPPVDLEEDASEDRGAR